MVIFGYIIVGALGIVALSGLIGLGIRFHDYPADRKKIAMGTVVALLILVAFAQDWIGRAIDSIYEIRHSSYPPGR